MTVNDITKRRKQAIPLLLVGIGLLALGILIGRSLAPRTSDHPSQGRLAGPEPDSASIHDQTEEGAVAAAAAFSQIMVGPSEDESLYRHSMNELAAPQWRNRAGELATNAIEFVRERYGTGGSVSFHPVRYRVDSYTGAEAVIELWGVVLGSGPNVGGIEESWITGTVRIAWIESEWKVAGQSSRGGPTPELLRSGGDLAASSQLRGFKGFAGAPEP